MNITPLVNGVVVLAFDGAVPFYLKSSAATCEPRHEWSLAAFLGKKLRGVLVTVKIAFCRAVPRNTRNRSSVVFVATTEANALPYGELPGRSARITT